MSLTPSSRRIAIIGGGISGVAAAYELTVRHPDCSFTLYEASSRLGGIVETVHERGFTVECGPDSWVTEKPWARELAEGLGLGGEIIPSNDYQRRTYIAQGRELLPMPDGLRMMVPTRWEPLLHSPLLSWEAKLAYLREPKNADALKASSLAEDADESVADFVLRHFGAEVNRMLAGPLLSGVFGGDISRLSVRAVMAPFVKMETEHGSLIEALRLRAAANPGKEKPATFTTLRSGLGTLIGRMVEHLPATCLRMATPVNGLSHIDDAWKVHTTSEVETFDTVLLATPAPVTRQLLSGMQNETTNQIADLLPTEASSAVVAALGYEQEKAARLRIPRGFGFLVPQTGDAASSLLACTFVDQKFSHRVPPGGVLLRGFFGGDAAIGMASASDEQIVRATREQLSRLLGPLPEADVSVIRHWPQSLPQYFVGHLTRIERAEVLAATLPGLHLLGSAYHGVGLPDLVHQACSIVSALVSDQRLKAAVQG